VQEKLRGREHGRRPEAHLKKRSTSSERELVWRKVIEERDRSLFSCLRSLPTNHCFALQIGASVPLCVAVYYPAKIFFYCFCFSFCSSTIAALSPFLGPLPRLPVAQCVSSQDSAWHSSAPLRLPLCLSKLLARHLARAAPEFTCSNGGHYSSLFPG
jgi:hypothetical protein